MRQWGLLWLRLGLLAGLLAHPGWAAAQTDAVTAQALMQRSGLWQQLASVGPQVRSGLLQALAQGGVATSPAETQRMVAVFDSAYAADKLRRVAAETLRLSTRPDMVAPLNRWYGSALGQRITQLEEAASADMAEPQASVSAGNALLAAMSPARTALINALMAATQSVEAVVQITVNTALASQQGLRSVAPDAPGPSADELAAALAEQKPAMRAAFTLLMRASFALTYRALGDAELADYLAFSRSEAGQHFLAVSISAFNAALVAASTELGQGLPGIKDAANT